MPVSLSHGRPAEGIFGTDLAAPTLTAAAGDGAIKLSWTAVTGAAPRYEIRAYTVEDEWIFFDYTALLWRHILHPYRNHCGQDLLLLGSRHERSGRDRCLVGANKRHRARARVRVRDRDADTDAL